MHAKYINLLNYYLVMNCKPRGEFLRKVISEVREGEFPYESREEKKVDWAMYDVAQCHEIADMIDMIRELVDSAATDLGIGKPKKRDRGRPSTPPDDVAKVLLLQSYLDVPNRVAEGMVYLFKEKLGLSKEFSYKTIERGYDKECVKKILDEVFRLTNEPVKDLEKIFSVDGSGTPTSIKQNYAQDRQRQNEKRSKETAIGDTQKSYDSLPRSADKKHDYVYKEAVIGTKYKLFAGWKSTTDHSIGETTMFPEVFAQAIDNHPNMEQILGDGIFATRPICKVVGQYGVTPRFLPRRNVTFKRKGVKTWFEMLWSLSEEPQEWLSEYHMRSISETGYSMLKIRNPRPLRKRLDPRKENEDYFRGIVHNIRRLCYLRYLEGIKFKAPTRIDT